MYLSKLILDKRDASVRQALRNCQDMHRNIMKAFAKEQSSAARKDCGVLYRLIEEEDILEEEGRTALYVLSASQPDWCALSRGHNAVGVKPIDAIVQSLALGDVYKFDLVCMPSRKVSQTGGNSRRVLLRTENDRAQWLQRKGDQHGFEVIWSREDGQCHLEGSHAPSGGGDWRFSSVHFTGMLRVKDVEAFRKAFCEGIGPEKAYGMGMLLLSKV